MLPHRERCSYVTAGRSGAVNSVDWAILHGVVVPISGAWPLFDRVLAFISNNDLFKGFIVMSTVWWLWLRQESAAQGEEGRDVRGHLIATLIACLVGLALARVLAESLPFRERPFALPEFNGAFTISREHAGLDEWSSFPSDHATLFVALAVGVWCAHARTGALLFAYVMVVVLLPRIYLGMHYPTDILGGGIIGGTIVWVANLTPVRQRLTHPFLEWHRLSPGTFYACAFLLTSQIAVLFDPVRKAAQFAAKLTHTDLG
jgi:membrane-associated phospholipid phosphatase